MFLKNQTLRFLRRLGLDRLGEARQARNVGVLVDHLDVALSDPGNDQLVVDPRRNDRVFRHGVTVVRTSVATGGAA